MLQIRIARIDDDDVARLREWLSELPSRRDELRESYRTHGTRHERFLLMRTRHGPVLVVVAEVADDDHATRSFLRSKLPIDVEFKTLLHDLGPEDAELEMLYDSRSVVG